ncbi:hypothetical protein FIU82_04720 [Pseudoalteromonas sp. THAF3]|nr:MULTISPECIES: DUF3750 domain-containing protein [Pseudoalteromonas]QFU04324.1 hypothetical protein FIU82_04720 [Pseudoalteromonas sp. THAF3]
MRALVITMLFWVLVGCTSTDWRTASRESAGIAQPVSEPGAVIEFYAADAFSWRGWFAVHTWLAIKEQGAQQYTVYEVVGWGVDQGRPALRSYKTSTPDRYWYGAKPDKFHMVSGAKAAELIPKIQAAAQQYPWVNEYTLFPGPNSNTFPAWIGRQVPELELAMPFSAIGSGYGD